MENPENKIPANVMLRNKVLHNTGIALRYYRFLKAYCERAVDSITWNLGAEKVPSYIESIAKTRLETLTILVHMERALETYKELCKIDGNIRPAKVIEMKFFISLDSNNLGKAYTNMELAEIFEVDRRTIDRDIREGKEKLGILLFGLHGLPLK